MSAGVNRLARVMDARTKLHGDTPPILDFGTIQENMSLLTNKFPEPIPYEDYTICRSVCYDPTKPLTMTWWQDEGWSGTDWTEQHWTHKEQPAEWKDRWGELINPNTGKEYWEEKHQTPDKIDHAHGPKGEHSHDEDDDGMHFHDVNLPLKMYRIQPGDRVLVAWVGDDACVIDIVMAATEMM